VATFTPGWCDESANRTHGERQVDVTTTDELLYDLLAHVVVLRTRATRLAQLAARHELDPVGTAQDLARLSERATEVQRLVQRLAGANDDRMPIVDPWPH
jgi:hypothetical protein